jgi:isoleucyl-tRNA synthetase
MTDTVEKSYKNTIFLPQTSFGMRANLNELEKTLLKFWKEIDLYEKLKKNSQQKSPFILHDGPPYANGHLHIGHALNKTLKDMTMKYQRMSGKYVPFIPGWDCHGLPIEWKVEEHYRAKKMDKDQVPILEFRQECRDFAQKWVDIQAQEFQQLGVIGDWVHPYLTMDFESEACTVEELHKVLMNESLYRGLKPVQWSVVEKTALAEAEVEYHEKISNSIYVLFPLDSSDPKFKNVHAIIWTTTPWSLPSNRAIAYNLDLEYVIFETKGWPPLLCAKALLKKVVEAASLEDVKVLFTCPGTELQNLVARHPWEGAGYDFPVPFLAGDHVTTDQGTGLVHTAPSHGVEDFELGKQHALEVPELVGEDGIYREDMPLFGGLHVFKADVPIIQALKDRGFLLIHTTIKHSYPHSWRSKAPLIYRATSQWFISMETNDLRKKALANIEESKWYPAQGKNRLRAMVENRPDWCLSRQRAWGVPIAVFVSKKTGEPLRDGEVNDRITGIIRAQGTDVWYSKNPQEFLGTKYKAHDYEQVRDTLDVWFESGTVHALMKDFPLSDLYLEGSDQHRGWFQSSLLESCATQDRAPYKAIMTHGFVVDEQGHKMSKSIGNTVNLQEILKNHGADILRLWIAGSDYFDDLRIGKETLKRYEEVYRKIRNTFRYLLGNLGEFHDSQGVPYDKLPDLEKWILHRLTELEKMVREKIEIYDFHHIFTALYNFCINDLSAFYFDIRKDTLYCDVRYEEKCLAVLTVLDKVFDSLCKWMAPILTFTMEEAWRTRFPEGSIHLEQLPQFPQNWHNAGIGAKWTILRDIRRVITGALELERSQGKIGSSLQAHVKLFLQDEGFFDLLKTINLPELMITSSGEMAWEKIPEDSFQLVDVPKVGVQVSGALGQKCVRCWRILPEVQELCERCHHAVSAYR